MFSNIPTVGAANSELCARAIDWWTQAAADAHVDLAGFDPHAPLETRVAWAQSQGLAIAAVLSRFSSKMQQSTEAQVMENITFAARNKMYVPPELICVDEGLSGRKTRRAGLDRLKAILRGHHASVLLVYKVSRLFRVAYKGFAFFKEEVADEGLRAISVSQNIDTAEEKTWRMLMYVHGLMDEMLLDTFADHVRSGLRSIFLNGYTVGPLPIGYRRLEVAGARPTKLGRPRTVPEVDPEIALMIRQHFEGIRDGMSIAEGWRRWVNAGGPVDARSTLKRMSYHAYHRLLQNERYTGRWAFGRKRSRWSSKRDYVQQVVQREEEVAQYVREELRIVSDELFFAVQQRLAQLKTGPRGPKRQKVPHLWDIVTELFWCPHCNLRYVSYGSGNRSMRCKNGILCPCTSSIVRRDAVRAICASLCELLNANTDLIEEIVQRSLALNTLGDGSIGERHERLARQIDGLSKKFNDLTDLAGEGTDEDRKILKLKIAGVQAERARLRAEQARLTQAAAQAATPLTAERVREILSDLTQLLENAANGKLGSDMVYKAARVFGLLVGGRIMVHVEQRAGRKRKNARGVFTPHLLGGIEHVEALVEGGIVPGTGEVSVWLRKPPRIDALAERVHDLVDNRKLTYEEATQLLQGEGHNIGCANIWQCRRRYFEMRGVPVPELPYNNGHPAKQPLTA